MRRRSIAVATICVLAVCTARVAAPSSSSAVVSSVPCGPAGARTLAASSGARVFAQSGSVYGCARGSRSIRLGSSRICNGTDLIGPAAAAGRLAAYGSKSCGIDTGSATVVVRRLSDRRVLYSQSAWSLATGPESYVSVTSLVVDRAGDVAWIATEASIVSHSSGTEVAERQGKGVRVLDQGAGIVPRSLCLSGTTLTWRLHGATHSAKLG